MNATTIRLLVRLIEALHGHPGITSDCTVSVHANYADIEGAPARDAVRELFAPLQARDNGEETVSATPGAYLIHIDDGKVDSSLYPQAPGELTPPVASRETGVDDMTDGRLAELLDWIASYRYDMRADTGRPAAWGRNYQPVPADADLIPIAEYAARHGRAASSVRQLARTGGLRTARRFGRDWWVDADEPYPDRRRRESTQTGPKGTDGTIGREG